MSTDLRLELIVKRYSEGDRWTWRLFAGSRIVSTSGAQLFTRRIDCAPGAEVGTGVSGVYDALRGLDTKGGGTAKRLAIRRWDGVTVRIVDAREPVRARAPSGNRCAPSTATVTYTSVTK